MTKMTVNQGTVLIIYLTAVRASLGETQTGEAKLYNYLWVCV